jgi:hypothetical protein
MGHEIFYGNYRERGPRVPPKGSLKFTTDGRHEVHVAGAPVAQIDGKELREYYLCNFGGSAGATAKQRFEALAMRCAREDSISFDAAQLKVAQTQEGRTLWEQARMEELAESRRGRK